MYLRKCVSCGKQDNKYNFIRVNKVNGEICVSECGCKNYVEGRTAYLCPSIDCFNLAKKKSRLEKNLKCKIGQDVYERLCSLISKNC